MDLKYNIWKDCRQIPLPELLDSIVDNRGKTVPTVNQNEACSVVLIATNCIRNENLYPVYEKIRFISEDTYKTWFRSHPIPGDIIFVNKGTPGRVCLCPDIIDFCIAQDMMAFRVDSNKLYNKYLLAVLRSRVMQEQIRITSVGDTIPHFKKEFLKDLYIPVPPMEIQRIIGDYYNNLSQKIELNKKINENLEQQAQAIFKSWFVDFEPFGGVMPDEWNSGNLGSFVTIKRGGSPRPIQNYLSETGYRWLKISDVTSLNSPFILDIKEHIIESGLKKTVFLKQGALVLSNSATPGIPKILDVDSCIHDGWLYFPESKLSNEYLYLLFKFIRKDLVALGNGSVFTNLKTDILKQYEISLPSERVLNDFQTVISPLFEAMRNIARENKSLAALRDTLLPKLMNGEIDVSQVQI